MKTFLGLEAPLPAHPDGVVHVVDLAVQLGRVKRFGAVGKLPEWSVLHHSFLVALLWLRAGYPLDELHHALLHDAHEAYTGDIPGPVKAAIRSAVPGGVNPFKAVEYYLDGRIASALGIAPLSPVAVHEPIRRRIKVVDLAALVIEGNFAGAPGCDCTVDIPADLERDVYALLEQAGWSRVRP